MALISALELTAMQATATSALPDTAQIRSRSYVPDGRGGQTATWSAPISVPCRLSPTVMRPSEVIDVSQVERAVSPWLVTLPATVTVNQTDRITVGNRTLEVLDVIDAPRSWILETLVHCQEVI